MTSKPVLRGFPDLTAGTDKVRTVFALIFHLPDAVPELLTHIVRNRNCLFMHKINLLKLGGTGFG